MESVEAVLIGIGCTWNNTSYELLIPRGVTFTSRHIFKLVKHLITCSHDNIQSNYRSFLGVTFSYVFVLNIIELPFLI